MKQSKAIVFDIDGVLADFEWAFCDKFGYNHRDYTNLMERYPEQRDVIEEFITDPGTYADLMPIFGGTVLLFSAWEKGYRIYLMTSRPFNSRDVTNRWLKYYNLYYDELIFTKNKAEAIQVLNDPRRLEPANIVTLIDDLPANFENLPRGVVGLSWEQPWNSDYYPKVRYHSSTMLLEVKRDTVSPWVNFWTGK